MPVLPTEIAAVLAPFAGLFSQPTWICAQQLLCGAILTCGSRTICAILRTLGLSQCRHFQNYHRVLNRAQWSSRQAARLLFMQLVEAFVPTGPLVLGIDEHLERRRGQHIAARGIYRDSARSSRSFFVKSSGLRWISLHVLAPIGWAGRIWALPFLTVLAPSERYHQERGQKHKTLTDWARQLVARVRRWCPHRALILVGDSTYAALEFLAWCLHLVPAVTVLTYLRLDAALYLPAPPPAPHKKGRPRKKGRRLPTLQKVLTDPKTNWNQLRLDWYGQPKRRIQYTSGTAVWYHAGLPAVPIRWVLVRDPEGVFESRAILSTDLKLSPEAILQFFMRRWAMEVTFEEANAHLGVEGQRQWSERAIARATPCLLGLFSVVALVAERLQSRGRSRLPILTTAWYRKERPTFADALAWVRWDLWSYENFWTSLLDSQVTKTKDGLIKHLSSLICRAA